MTRCTFLLIAAIFLQFVSGSMDGTKCPCPVLKRPQAHLKDLTARWMVHTLSWGTISTISTRLSNEPTPFGNTISFVDGSCGESTGTPYFYGSLMDQTFKDTTANPVISLTLSEASLSGVCGAEALTQCLPYATIDEDNGEWGGDPENPLCARLTMTGQMVMVEKGSEEFKKAQAAFFHRHPQMASWPADHGWIIGKMEIQDLWLIDFFGGAAILDIHKYKKADPTVQLESVN